MTPAERLAILERLDAVIRERNTWTDLHALGAYEELWEMAYVAAYQAVQVAAAARRIVELDCCDLHGRNCEQGGEECCDRCTEAHHFAPGHGGVPCSSPVLTVGQPEDGAQ